LTETVERRTLTNELVFRGTVTAAQSTDVGQGAGLAGAVPIVTRLPLAPGDALDEGGVSIEVSGRPVLVFAGDFPFYRDLAVGDSGPDVNQLETALERMGLKPGRVDGHFDANTADAVRRAWEAVGYVAATAPSPTTIGSDGAEQPVPSYSKVPLAEVAVVPAFPVSATQIRAVVGQSVDGSPITLASGDRFVVVTTSPADAPLVDVGAVVEVVSQDGTRRNGTVASEPVATPDAGGPAEVRFNVAVDEPFTAADVGLGVKVTVQVAEVADVLVVPLVAISSSTSGRTTVNVVDDSGASRTVTVRVGITADGFAQIDGDVTPGERVRVG